MRRTSWMGAALAVPVLGAAACSYPAFSFGPSGGSGGSPPTSAGSGAAGGTGPGGSGAGGRVAGSSGSGFAGRSSAGGGRTTGSSGVTGGSGQASSVSSTAGSGGASCTLGHLVISEVRSRGLQGASDEFVELYNPTATPVKLDGSWSLEGHTLDPNVHTYSTRWAGKGLSIPADGHYLIVGSRFSDGVPFDDSLSVGITDASSLRLRRSGADVDVVCYFHANDLLSAAGFADITNYDCAQLPAGNPHDDTSATDTDASVERKPGGAAGNCTDSGDNGVDFVQQSPSTPESAKSPPAP